MKHLLIAVLLATSSLSAFAETAPIKGIMILGGCCHDYVKQKMILAEGTAARANIVWTLYQESTERNHKNSAYTAEDWYKDYDVVLHSECYGGVTDDAFMDKVTKAHREGGLGGVNLHCSMHSYRAAKGKEWHKYLGVDHYGHGPKSPIKVEITKQDHPVVKGIKDFTTKEGELYTIKNLYDGTDVLAQGTRIKKPETDASK